MTNTSRDPAPITFLRETEVKQRTGFSAAQLDNLEVRGQFPRRVPIGDRAVAWIAAEVELWQRERIAMRDNAAADERARLARTPTPMRSRVRDQAPA